MTSEYQRIKYYSNADWSIGMALREASNKLDKITAETEFGDINEVIELYNIKKLFDSGMRLKEWTDEQYDLYKERINSFMKTIGEFFSEVDDSNFVVLQKKTCVTYQDDFWELVEKNKVYNRISDDVFKNFLDITNVPLYRILQHSAIVRRYDTVIADFMRSSDQSAKIIIEAFLRSEKNNYSLPSHLLKNEYETILQLYVDSESPNPNELKIIYESKSTAECPISDGLRLKARNKFKQYWEEHQKQGISIETGVSVSFQNQNDIVRQSVNGSDIHISYDISWFRNNLDYPTLLNNFFYIFDMFDLVGRCKLVSVKSQISAIERVFMNKAKNTYERGQFFIAFDGLTSAQMSLYYSFLKENGIWLEDVFRWFFMEYLSREFSVTDFCFNPPSEKTTYAEKCRILVSEMDGVLKQFRMFVRDGRIDRELFEISSEHMIISNIQSQIMPKYAYAKSPRLVQSMFAFFSDQSVLSYTSKTKDKYSTLFDLLRNEKVSIDDFAEYQRNSILELEERGFIKTVSGDIQLSEEKVLILRDLYKHDVLCIQYFNESKSVLLDWIYSDDLRVGNTLFSEPEENYINFILNRSKYSDGLDLRNKYSHGSNSLNEEDQHRDYIRLLKVMIMVIVKINEEFCLTEKNNVTIDNMPLQEEE